MNDGVINVNQNKPGPEEDTEHEEAAPRQALSGADGDRTRSGVEQSEMRCGQ